MRLRIVYLLIGVGAAAAPCSASSLLKAVPVPRGSEEGFTVSIENPTTIDVASASFEAVPIVAGIPGVYVLESAGSTSCDVQNGILGSGATVVLTAAPVPARSRVNCSFHVHRSLLSDTPADLDFKPAAGSPPGVHLSESEWAFGPLLDLSLEVEQIHPFPSVGASTGFMRVLVRNTSPWNVEDANFGYCQTFALAPFTLDNAVQGGCDDATWGPTCFATGAPSVQFEMKSLLPGETRSCVLRATASTPLVEPIRYGISLVEMYLDGDEMLQDYDRRNDDATLEIAPIGGAARAADVSLSSPALALLTVVLLALGVVCARTSRPTSSR